MYFVGQKWEGTPWGVVEIVWMEESDKPEIVKVQYAINGDVVPNMTLAHRDCQRCMSFPIVVPPHDNCRYHGQSVGHSKTHCSAKGCW